MQILLGKATWSEYDFVKRRNSGAKIQIQDFHAFPIMFIIFFDSHQKYVRLNSANANGLKNGYHKSESWPFATLRIAVLRHFESGAKNDGSSLHQAQENRKIAVQHPV